MDQAKAEGFYAVHAERPFFGELVNLWPVVHVFMVLEGENAVLRIEIRAQIPRSCRKHLRKLYANSIGENAVHGSDLENAAIEVYFFNENELH